jgi:hypothetical protein
MVMGFPLVDPNDCDLDAKPFEEALFARPAKPLKADHGLAAIAGG